MAKQGHDLLEPIGNGPRREVEASGRRRYVLSGVEIGLQRLDELGAVSLVGKQRAELPTHSRVREITVREQQPLESELLRIRDPTAQAEPLCGAGGLDKVGI